MNLQAIDYTVVIIYGVLLLVLAQWVSREKAGHEKNTQDYFLAGRALPWWAIGASLIAANISAEQIIGMSGSAYLMGVAIASYEWMAALVLIVYWIALATSTHVPKLPTVSLDHGDKIAHFVAYAGLAMAFKLLVAMEERWRRVNAPHLVALVAAGVAGSTSGCALCGSMTGCRRCQPR